MKVLHILDHSIPLHSGYTFRTRSILSQQRTMGIDTVHITSSKQGNADELLEELVEDFKFYRCPAPKGFFSKVSFLEPLTVISQLKKRLREVALLEKPDILHAHSPALNGIAAIQIGKELGIPVVYEVRGFWEDAAVDHGTTTEGSWRYKLTREMETYVVKNCDAVTAICDGIKKDLVARGVSEDKITLIPNAVNIEQFQQIEEVNLELIEELGLQKSFVLGFAGSFYQYEGIDILIRALALLKKEKLDVKVLLVGGGIQLGNIKALIKELQLESDVILTGRVPHESVKEYYGVMNLTVLPRKSMRLTELVTPLKPIEAMALGVPVVASDIGGHLEIIKNKHNGFLFEKDNEVALAELIKSLMNDQSNIPDIVSNAREYVETVRNWKVSVDNYPHVYERALKSKS